MPENSEGWRPFVTGKTGWGQADFCRGRGVCIMGKELGIDVDVPPGWLVQSTFECGSSSYRLLCSVNAAKAHCSTPKGGSCCYRTQDSRPFSLGTACTKRPPGFRGFRLGRKTGKNSLDK